MNPAYYIMAGNTSSDSLKKIACDAIDNAAGVLNEISHDIWSHPEEAFQEHHAHKILTNFLEKRGFPVERQFVSDTGFRAVYGEGGIPNISVLCEYDCLPEIGHACGHNLIAEAGIGAALGIQAALQAAAEQGQHLGKLTVLGTPAEESGGGKIQMVKGGVFDGVDVSMMVHPASMDIPDLKLTARQEVVVCYHGKASHAAGFPWEGVNALDAAVLAYNNISVLRQQMRPTWRVHGVMSNGGAKPNIIPELTELTYYLRAPTITELELLKVKVTSCFQAAASATGCKVDMTWESDPYYNTLSNPTLTTLYKANANSLGVKFSNVEGSSMTGGSTDMGNVGHVVPSIHPVFSIGDNTFLHSRPYTASAGSPTAQPYTLTQAKAMAMTAIDVYCQAHLVGQMKAELVKQLQHESKI